MTEHCQAIIDYLGCECVVYENETSGDRIIGSWNKLKKQGKKEGFFPLLILPEDTLAETLELALEDADMEATPENIAALRNSILKEAEGIDPQEFFKNRLAEYKEVYEDSEVRGEFKECEPDDSFCSHMDGNNPYPELIIAKIPAKNPWELAAWAPMGGFNECPTPAQQVAVFKYWHEKYNAIPGVVTGANWELELTRPPSTDADAEALAEEHFAFCEDIVVQAASGWNSIRARASSLKNSTTWFFWWD